MLTGASADIADVLRGDPDWLGGIPLANQWIPDADGYGTNSDRFGSTRTRVALDRQGKKLFMRTTTREARHMNAAPWYVKHGVYYFGVAEQERHFALNPDRTTPDKPLIFAQPVMGFTLPFPKVADAFLALVETEDQAAIREALEEMGVYDVIDVVKLLDFYVQPTFVETPTPVYLLRINPKTIGEHTDKSEFIKKVTFLDAREIDLRLNHVDELGRRGWYKGVCYNSASFRVVFDAWARYVGILRIG